MVTESHLPLADIQEPYLSSVWPLAPLWWLLLLLTLVSLAWAVRHLVHTWQKQQALREAKKEWQALEPGQTTELNQLVKRVIQHYKPLHPVLSAPLASWQAFLQSLTSTHVPPLEVLLYQPNPAPQLQQEFYQAVGDILKTLRVKKLESLCLN